MVSPEDLARVEDILNAAQIGFKTLINDVQKLVWIACSFSIHWLNLTLDNVRVNSVGPVVRLDRARVIA